MIDLRSDTVTKPTPGMKEAMMNARVGDDVFGEDESVNLLEQKVARMFGKEAALFCPSGTMTNQIAIKVHTSPGEEVICDRLAHVYNYEGGGIAFNSGASVRLLYGELGCFTAADVEENINPPNDHYPLTKLVSAENTVNRGSGSIFPINELRKIRMVCNDHQLAYHLDGARLFNALVETHESPDEYGELFDSISICLSKGLGAPVGSVLTGSHEFIKKAHRIRKVLGGGMRQAGFLAAAGIYALDHHIERLAEDHQRAAYLSQILESLHFVEEIMPVKTNIIIFKLNDNLTEKTFVSKMREKEILTLVIGKQKIRMVTHLDFTDEMMEKTEKALKSL